MFLIHILNFLKSLLLYAPGKVLIIVFLLFIWFFIYKLVLYKFNSEYKINNFILNWLYVFIYIFFHIIIFLFLRYKTWGSVLDVYLNLKKTTYC